MAPNNTDATTQPGLDTLGGGDPTTLDQQLPQMTAPQPGAGGVNVTQGIPPFPMAQKPAPTGPAPGSFGWKLANTLKGLQQGLAGLGDAAAVGKVEPGGGWIEGVTRTLAAGTERRRVEQERRDKLAQQERENTREDWKAMSSIAIANAQMHREQFLATKMGEEARDAGIGTGQQMIANWTTAAKSPVQPILTHVTSSQLKGMIGQKNNDGTPKIDPAKVTAFPDGKMVVGEDPATGMPQYATTYTVLPVPKEYTLQDEDQEWVDYLNKANPNQQWHLPTGKPGDANYKPGDTMPGYLANELYQQYRNLKTFNLAREEAAEGQKLAEEATDFKLAGVMNAYMGNTIPNSPSWGAAYVSAAQAIMNDWYAGRNGLKAKFANPMEDIYRSLDTVGDDGKVVPGSGKKNFMELAKEQQAQFQKIDPLVKFQEDPKQFEGQAAGSAQSVLQGVINRDPLTGRPATGARLAQATGYLAVAKQAHDGYVHDEQEKLKYGQELKEGDPVELGKLAAEGVAGTTYSILLPRFASGTWRAQFLDTAMKHWDELHPDLASKGVHFSMEKFKDWGQEAGNATNDAFFGSTRSLLEQGGQLDQLMSARAGVPNFKSPLFNKWDDVLVKMEGDDAIAKYASAGFGVAMAYSRIENGGAATQEVSQKAQDLVLAALNSNQLRGSLQEIGSTARSMQDGRIGYNPFLWDKKSYQESAWLKMPKPMLDRQGNPFPKRDGYTLVQIPGQDPQYLPNASLKAAKDKYPNLLVGE